eukprot:TRINITY_DN6123_c0_g1_i1.p2 TRINITY_DN6123_c0_g1~~TRINITY_DN6123_c0_g1_i1.p2  ORF type:complete len:121 (+),score=20.48 TRINITY_DN6123_c0_g1_i1:48-410(+)
MPKTNDKKKKAKAATTAGNQTMDVTSSEDGWSTAPVAGVDDTQPPTAPQDNTKSDARAQAHTKIRVHPSGKIVKKDTSRRARMKREKQLEKAISRTERTDTTISKLTTKAAMKQRWKNLY